jgi:hypothetical protein
MFIEDWLDRQPSSELGENPALIGENLVELFLVPEQPIQLGLIALDTFLVGENLPLIGQNLSLVRNRRVCHPTLLVTER